MLLWRHNCKVHFPILLLWRHSGKIVKPIFTFSPIYDVTSTIFAAPETKAQEEGITPSIVTKPKAQVVDEGEIVSFTCKLMASPEPSVSGGISIGQ